MKMLQIFKNIVKYLLNHTALIVVAIVGGVVAPIVTSIYGDKIQIIIDEFSSVPPKIMENTAGLTEKDSAPPELKNSIEGISKKNNEEVRLLSGWIYIGLYRGETWKGQRSHDQIGNTPQNLIGKNIDIDFNQSLNLRTGPFIEADDPKSPGCEYIPSNTTGQVIQKGTTLKIDEIHDLCNGYIWAKIHTLSD